MTGVQTCALPISRRNTREKESKYTLNPIGHSKAKKRVYPRLFFSGKSRKNPIKAKNKETSRCFNVTFMLSKSERIVKRMLSKLLSVLENEASFSVLLFLGVSSARGKAYNMFL